MGPPPHTPKRVLPKKARPGHRSGRGGRRRTAHLVRPPCGTKSLWPFLPPAAHQATRQGSGRHPTHGCSSHSRPKRSWLVREPLRRPASRPRTGLAGDQHRRWRHRRAGILDHVARLRPAGAARRRSALGAHAADVDPPAGCRFPLGPCGRGRSCIAPDDPGQVARRPERSATMP